MSYIFYQAYQTERQDRFKLSRLTSHKFRRLEMLKILKQTIEFNLHWTAVEKALKLPEDMYARQWLCSLGTSLSSISVWPAKYFHKSFLLFLPLTDSIDVVYGVFKRLGDAKPYIQEHTKIIEANTVTPPTCFIEEPKGDEYGSIWEQNTTS